MRRHRPRWARCRRCEAGLRPPARSTGPVRRRRGHGRVSGQWESRSVRWPRSRARTIALAWPWAGTLAFALVGDTQESARSDDPGRARLDAAWRVWIDSKEAAIQTVRTAEGVPRTAVDESEGYRWVTRLASLAQEWFIEKSDPLHPQLFQSQTEYRKLLVDNPDVRYGFCALDETRTYRLVGTRGEAAYIGLTFGTPVGKGPVDGKTGTTVQAHIDQFDLGPKGEVDILIVPVGSPAARPKNCIEMAPGTGQLAVRETFFDRRLDQPADLRIELVGGAAPPVLGAEELAG